MIVFSCKTNHVKRLGKLDTRRTELGGGAFFHDWQVSHELYGAIGAVSSSGAVVTMLLCIALMFHSHMTTKLVLEEARAMALGKARALTQRHVERLFVALQSHRSKQSLFRPERIWVQQKTETSVKALWLQRIVRAKHGSVSFGEHYKFQCPLQIRAQGSFAVLKNIVSCCDRRGCQQRRALGRE